MSRRALRGVVAGVVFCLATPLASQEWRGPEDLEVRVEDAKGRDLAGAEVVLEYATRQIGGPAPLLTDANGRVAVGGLLPGRWSLEVRKPGFMSFRAEIALAAGDKPEIVLASQHNVPGAESTMRVRIGRARNAPAAPARVARVAPAPPPAAPRAVGAPATPVAPTPATPPEEPAPEPDRAAPVPVAQPSTRPSPPPQPTTSEAPPSAPAAVHPPPAPPVAETREAAPPAPPSAAAEAAAPPAAPVAAPEPTARPDAPAPISAPSAPSPARVTAPAPIARACYECRPGESALLAEAAVEAGGGECPSDLPARLASVELVALPELLASLPAGCAVMAVELAPTQRYAGFRYEAAGPNGRSEDCLPGRSCPAGGCRFPSEPVIRKAGESTVLLAPFESAAARRGGFTVYWRRGR